MSLKIDIEAANREGAREFSCMNNDGIVDNA
jgi:hypothetical protein